MDPQVFCPQEAQDFGWAVLNRGHWIESPRDTWQKLQVFLVGIKWTEAMDFAQHPAMTRAAFHNKEGPALKSLSIVLQFQVLPWARRPSFPTELLPR